ncbi:MAG TPA: hypothetical protein ENK66_03830 [Arcobacter sp.]|nr:hypothetical protein [Arcobacter sp.]
MLKKLYVHNFKCLQKFEFDLNDLQSAFLLGKNGSGKTTIFEAIEIFQKIGQGVTSLDDLFDETSFHFNNINLPIELKLDVHINRKKYIYKLVIDFPKNFVIPRVKNEELRCDDKLILAREGGKTRIKEASNFSLDWHHIGLPLISVNSKKDSLEIFRKWLKNIIIISPFPRHFHDLSKKESSILSREGENLIDWLRYLLSSNPSLYSVMYNFLKKRMPDLEVFKFENLGRDDRRLIFEFRNNNKSNILDFAQLSDGEKIICLGAAILAGQRNNENLLCLWDEPDNFISLTEVKHFTMEFRRTFEKALTSPQLIICSHNERVINSFSNHNIFVLKKRSHLLSTEIILLENIDYISGTLIDAYEHDELDS